MYVCMYVCMYVYVYILPLFDLNKLINMGKRSPLRLRHRYTKVRHRTAGN